MIRILGHETATRLLEEGWKPNAQEAKNIGLVAEVVEHENLHNRAQVSDKSDLINAGKIISFVIDSGRGMGKTWKTESNSWWRNCRRIQEN